MNHYFKLLAFVFFVSMAYTVNGQVNITKGTGGESLCADGGAYTTLSDIEIQENGLSDFLLTNGETIILSAPAGYEFNPGVGVATGGPGPTITNITVTASTITIDYDNPGSAVQDSILIIGIQVRAMSGATDVPAAITRTGGNATINGAPVGPTSYADLGINATSSVTGYDAVCNGGASGAAKVTHDFGGAVTYDWLPGNPNGDGTDSIFNLAAGPYSVLVTENGSNCTVTDNVVIGEATALNVSISGSSNVTTMGGNDGSATANTPTGGTPVYTYDWKPGTPTGDGTLNITNLTANTYWFVVTDNAGCMDSASVVITEPLPLTGGTIGTNHYVCAGDDPDAMTEVAPPSNGVMPYTFQWQISTDASSWTNIGGANANTYDPPTPIGQTTYYRRRVTDNTGIPQVAYSNVVVATYTLLPSVAIFGLNSPYCVNDADVNFSGFPANANGSFNVELGLTDNGDGTGVFSPSGSGATGGSPRNIIYTYTDPTTGCVNSDQVNVDVNPLPNGVNFTGLSNSYSQDENPDNLSGIPSGGVFSGPGIVGNTFYPGGVPLDSVLDISYTYTDPGTGCSRTSTKQTLVTDGDGLAASISGANNYCEYEGNQLIVGQPGNGYFSACFFTNCGLPPGWFPGGNNTQVILNPTVHGVGSSLIYYNYLDSISFCFPFFGGCTYFAFPNARSKVVTVHGVPNPTINLADTIFCSDDPSVLVSGSPVPVNGNQTGIFTSTGTIFDLSNGTAILNPSTNTAGNIDIDYEFQTDYGDKTCTSNATVDVDILAPPVVDFDLSSTCLGDTTQFTDLSSLDALDTISTWLWDFGDGSIDSVQNPTYAYSISGNYFISLEITTGYGCDARVLKPYSIFDPPIADFDFDNVCFGDPTQFTDQTTVFFGSITNWNWLFDDPASGGNNVSTLQNPQHTFSNRGTYNVSLDVETSTGCVDSIVKVINVRKIIQADSFPYVEDFESGNGDWYAQGISGGVDTTSWNLGNPNGILINDPGTNAWMTGTDNNYFIDEQSYVDGPCFQFDSLVRPMISMDIWYDLETGRDGAVLQYSIDDGATWNNVGTTTSPGISWFNDGGISSSPGGQIEGWSGTINNWQNARHNLDPLVGESKVLLRVALGSDVNNTKDGFAFDNIWIGERTRTVLVEHFTNSSDPNSASENPALNASIAANSLDVVDLQYHMDVPGYDPMNADNQADPNARSLFYGAVNVPRSIMDGNVFNGTTSFLTGNLMRKRALVDPQFDIEFLSATYGGGNVGADVKFTALDTVNSDFNLRVVVVEKSLAATDFPGGSITNGETTFMSVEKQMLPAASGTFYSQSWLPGEADSTYQAWTMQNVYDQTNMRIIAFIQDAITKEVYQAAYIDPAPGATAPPPPTTGINEDRADDISVSLYPNPAQDKVFLEINEGIGKRYGYTITNQLGEVLVSGEAESTVKEVIDLSSLPSGLYLVDVKDESSEVVKKLIIHK